MAGDRGQGWIRSGDQELYGTGQERVGRTALLSARHALQPARCPRGHLHARCWRRVGRERDGGPDGGARRNELRRRDRAGRRAGLRGAPIGGGHSAVDVGRVLLGSGARPDPGSRQGGRGGVPDRGPWNSQARRHPRADGDADPHGRSLHPRGRDPLPVTLHPARSTLSLAERSLRSARRPDRAHPPLPPSGQNVPRQAMPGTRMRSTRTPMANTPTSITPILTAGIRTVTCRRMART